MVNALERAERELTLARLRPEEQAALHKQTTPTTTKAVFHAFRGIERVPGQLRGV